MKRVNGCLVFCAICAVMAITVQQQWAYLASIVGIIPSLVIFLGIRAIPEGTVVIGHDGVRAFFPEAMYRPKSELDRRYHGCEFVIPDCDPVWFCKKGTGEVPWGYDLLVGPNFHLVDLARLYDSTEGTFDFRPLVEEYLQKAVDGNKMELDKCATLMGSRVFRAKMGKFLTPMLERAGLHILEDRFCQTACDGCGDCRHRH